MKAALFDAGERRARHGATRELVVLGLTFCPECGRRVTTEVTDEFALLRHGGYGATRTTSRLHCHCGWSLLREVTETRPPRSS